MNNQFIVLTTTENTEIIIGISNISTIRAAYGNSNMTEVMFNFADGSDVKYPRKIEVKDSFESVKSKLGL
jgi:hypothetical protein